MKPYIQAVQQILKNTMISCEDLQPKCFSISSAVPAGFFTPRAKHIDTNLNAQ
jgi:hypothetical protein